MTLQYSQDFPNRELMGGLQHTSEMTYLMPFTVPPVSHGPRTNGGRHG